MNAKHRRPVDRSQRRLGLVAILAVTLLSLATAAPAGAAKGQGGGGKPSAGSSASSIRLVLLDSPDDVANHGERVTFAVSTSATTRPFVSLNCYQGSEWVYSASIGVFDGYLWAQEFTLASTSWPSGSADCTARLYSSKDGIRTTTLATMPVPVAG